MDQVPRGLLNEAKVLRCLATSPRFQRMSVAEALAELKINGMGHDDGAAIAQAERVAPAATRMLTSWDRFYDERDHEKALTALLGDINAHPDPDTMEPTNDQRRDRARWAVAQYARSQGRYHQQDDADSVAIDLLADLMHLGDVGDIEFERALQTARCHHTTEAR